MKLHTVIAGTLCLLCSTLLLADEQKYQVEQVDQLPEELSEKVSGALNPQGLRVKGADDLVCEVWLANEVSVQANFNATLTIKYPFQPGHLLGAIRVPEKTEMTDFRGNKLKAGVYTLRYAHQPVDGNHIGTSETYDFLLAVPAPADADPKPFGSTDQLSSESAKSVSASHPAIFWLLPAEKKPEQPQVEFDDREGFWVLTFISNGKADGEAVEVPVRMVVIGQTFE